VILFCSPKTLRKVALAIIVLSPFLRALATPFFSTHFPIYFLSPFRADSLCAGAFVAISERQIPNWISDHRFAAQRIAITGASAFILLTALPSFRTGSNTVLFNSLGYSLIALFFAAALVLTLHLRQGPVHALLSSTPLRYLGRISYTFYLWHWAVLIFLSAHLHSSALIPILAFLATLAISAISWHFIEAPILATPASSARSYQPAAPVAALTPARCKPCKLFQFFPALQRGTPMPQLTYLEAIRQGIWEEMERDPTVFCIGEDIGIYGGAFKVTDGFIDHFGPERVIDTPIAESAIVGAAFGASLTGLRPVAEFQFMDFIGCAFNQIVNMVAKAHYRWGAPAPLVVRGPSGGNVHGGPFHSQNPEMWFVHAPGLKVVCPASAYDAKGLIKASIRDNNPVIFFEHKYLYRRIKEEVPADDYIVPLGKARIARVGSSLSIITYAAMVFTALEAAEELAKDGIDVEVVDLRTVSPLDREAIAATVRKTNKVIILHEHARTGGLAGEIAAIINEEAFDSLDGPIVRLTSQDSPVPFSPPQEEYFLPQVKDVIAAAYRLAEY
jgi:2-oxoisovalerate dehydrogenase E1 component beta subunit